MQKKKFVARSQQNKVKNTNWTFKLQRFTNYAPFEEIFDIHRYFGFVYLLVLRYGHNSLSYRDTPVEFQP